MKTLPATGSPKRFAIVSTCPEFWGGSEELWSAASVVLARKGHRVSAFKTRVDDTHPRVKLLKSLSCSVTDLRHPPITERLVIRYHLLRFALNLKSRRPDLVIISQGDNYDGLHFGQLCRRLGLPYTLISQKATDHFWPKDKSRQAMREIFQAAAQCFFVSNHNRELTENQIGVKLTNASVVRNPFLVSAEKAVAWPRSDDDTLRLACVARLYLLDKGQDILLKVLAQEKWKNRKLHVSFFGQGMNSEGLRDLATKLDLQNVSFEGQTSDVVGIWETHHALILASRAEGLPLSLVEAMMSGRPGIVTDVGGNSEVVDDRVNGFLAAPSVAGVDAALEDAWTRRDDLQRMGELAAIKIRELVPPRPEEEFAANLLGIVESLEKVRRANTVASASRHEAVREQRSST